MADSDIQLWLNTAKEMQQRDAEAAAALARISEDMAGVGRQKLARNASWYM